MVRQEVPDAPPTGIWKPKDGDTAEGEGYIKVLKDTGAIHMDKEKGWVVT